MSQDDHDTPSESTRSVSAIEDELIQVDLDFEALRARGPHHWLLHALMVALFGTLGAGLIWMLGAMVTLVMGVPEWSFHPVWIPVLATAFSVTSVFMWPNLAVPKKGAQKPLQELFERRTSLKSELQHAHELEARLARERAELQRDAHGGNLSIARDSPEGGLEVTHEDARVVLDLDADEAVAKAPHTVDAHHDV